MGFRIVKREGWPQMVSEEFLAVTDKMCDDLEALREYVDRSAFEELPYEVAIRVLEARSSIGKYLLMRRGLSNG